MPLLAVVLTAIAVRLVPLLFHHGLTGVLGSDDGVYYAAGANLVHGRFPYRDFVFVHPPGIALFTAPFAGSARWLGDADALALSRIAVGCVGGLTAGLVYLVLRRTAPAWALWGALAYAVWSVPVDAERTIFMEPLLNLLLTAGLFVAFRGPANRRTGAELLLGVLLGVGLGLKLWVGPEIVVLALFLARTRGVRSFLAVVLGSTAAFGVLVLPFLRLSPATAIREVVTLQLGRSGVDGLTAHLVRFSFPWQDPPGTSAPHTLLAAAFLIGLLAAGVLGWNAAGHDREEARAWILVMGVQLLEVAAAPSYWNHYLAFASASCVIVASRAGSLLADSRFAQLPTSRANLLPAAVGAGVALPLLALTIHLSPSAPDPGDLRAFTSAHRCTWFEGAAQAVTANALTPHLENGCRPQVDRYGTLMSLSIPVAYAPMTSARNSAPMQALLLDELSGSDSAVVASRPEESYLGPGAMLALRRDFILEKRAAGYDFWVRRP